MNLHQASFYKMLRATLLGQRPLAPEVHHFDFEVPDVETLHFTSGQFISIVKSIEGKEITRAYSIASSQEGNRFSLCLNRVQDGMISPYLFSLQPGEVIDIQEPLGYFTLRHPGHRIVFVATGTGIAPFRSMLLHHLPSTQPEVTLLFGARYAHGLLYRDEFEKLVQQYPKFRFLPTVTRPDETWQGRVGRVGAHLNDALSLRTPDDLSKVDVYICGLREMVDNIRAELKANGFDRKQVIYERYD